MKKISFIILIMILMVSCEITKTKWVAPPFTSVDKIVNVKPGFSPSQVYNTLGIEPYDVYHISDEVGSVYVYYYRLKERRMSVPIESKNRENVIHSESGQKDGEIWYKDKAYRLYLFFKDDKLKSLVTDGGRDDSEYILLLNNNIQLISKEEISTFSKDVLSKEETIKDGYIINKNFEQGMPLKLKFSKPDTITVHKNILSLPKNKKTKEK